MQEQAIDAATLRRWRLILGPEAAQPLAAAQPFDDADARRDAALDYLYQREHRLREQPDGAGTDAWQGTGGLSARQGGSGVPEPQAVHWLGEVRDLFPRSAVETLQRDALSRYGLHGLLSDPQVLAEATPSIELVAALMAVRTSLPPRCWPRPAGWWRAWWPICRRGCPRACTRPWGGGAGAAAAGARGR